MQVKSRIKIFAVGFFVDVLAERDFWKVGFFGWPYRDVSFFRFFRLARLLVSLVPLGALGGCRYHLIF